MLNSALKNLLLEISIKDHFDKYGDKFGYAPHVQSLSANDFKIYQIIAEFDPTSREGTIKGKYTEWLLKITKKLSKKEKIPTLVELDITKLLQDYSKISNVDINKFKTIEDFISYMDEFGGTVSEREKKQKAKEIFNDEENIDIIDVTDEWIIAQPLTWEGSKKLACYKVTKGADWCTARANDEYHWTEYTGTKSGSLFIIINKLNPLERYQIFQNHLGVIGEATDYHNNHISYEQAYELIWMSNILRKNYLDLDEADRAMQVELKIHEYKNHGDGTVSVEGDVLIKDKPYTKLPVKFKRVMGTFLLKNLTKLETLEGCPEFCKAFGMNSCSVKSLIGGTKRCNEYVVDWCNLESLKGCPETVVHEFSITFCSKLNQLDAVPQGDIENVVIDMCGDYFHESPEDESWRQMLKRMGCNAETVYIH